MSAGKLPLPVALGRVVRELRTARNLSQDALGQLCGMNGDRIAQLEAGEDEPDLVELFAIAGGLQVRGSDLLLRVARYKNKTH